MNLQFFVNMAQLKFYRVVTDLQFDGGGRIMMSFDDQFQKAHFVRREIVFDSFRQANLAEKFDDAIGDFGRYKFLRQFRQESKGNGSIL